MNSCTRFRLWASLWLGSVRTWGVFVVICGLIAGNGDAPPRVLAEEDEDTRAFALSRPAVQPPLDQRPLHREPVSVLAVDKQRVLVANRRAGSVRLIRLNQKARVQARLAANSEEYDETNSKEVPKARGAAVGATIPQQDWATASLSVENTGRLLSHLLAVPHGGWAVLDEAHGEIWRFDLRDDALHTIEHFPVGRSPLHAACDADGKTIAIANLWSHEVTVLTLTNNAILPTGHKISVPFAPRLLSFFPDQQHLLVLDAFGGEVAVVDVPARRVVRRFHTPAHNFRGIALIPDQSDFYLTHQIMNSGKRTTQDAIHWGDLINNLVSVYPIKKLLAGAVESEPTVHEISPARDILLGTTGKGAADPGQIAVAADGRLLVALEGVDAIAVFSPQQNVVIDRVSVGTRPRSLALLPESTLAVVANSLDDTLSVVEYSLPSNVNPRVTTTISLGKRPVLTGKDHGERLFFSARLSHDQWLSCHSCHTDGHSNGGLVDTLGDGDYGAPKRVLSLLGTGDTDPWGWNGSQRTILDQVERSVATTMHSDRPFTREEALDLAVYLQSLAPAPPVQPVKTNESDPLVERGKQLFNSLGCANCHVPTVAFTTYKVLKVDMADELGRQSFNPPSLRGVSQRPHLFHDNRADSLETAFRDHQHQLESPLSGEDLQSLVRYLRSL